MSTLIITGSPSRASRTLGFARSLTESLRQRGLDCALLDLRGLPAEPLLHAQVEVPAIRDAITQLAAASGVVIVTPVYKAAYSGLLKTFLDLLPQFALRGKVVLPLAMGGTLAHVLAIDYALRPVLNSLDPLHIVGGLFVLDQQVSVLADDRVELSADLVPKLDVAIAAFVGALSRGE